MSSKSESYGTKFVIVGSKASVEPPPRQLPKRTPSRLDNARRWAPAAYARNHAETNRHRYDSQNNQSAPAPVPPRPISERPLPPAPVIQVKGRIKFSNYCAKILIELKTFLIKFN